LKTYGRTTIVAPYTEQELLDLYNKKDFTQLDKIITDIIQSASAIHDKNRSETQYLKDYLYGKQDIDLKIKHTREEINNKTTENWVWAFADFKKTYLLGKPIQYVELDGSSANQISTLNKYVKYDGKKAKDMQIYEDMLICGRGFRYIGKNNNFKDGKAPFESINCNPEDTEVVYSNRLGNEQLFAYIETPMQYTKSVTDDRGELVEQKVDYSIFTVYLRNGVLTYSDKGGSLLREGEPDQLLWGEHVIVEYFLNKKRISMVEIGKDLFDDINYLESLDKDDMEQFVNAILVFTNATVSEEDLADIKKLGAVSINSTEQKKASIDLLQGRLNANDTQTYYNRLLMALHQILGVPMAGENGSVTFGDTGQAKLTGQGFTDAGIRAEGDTTMFGVCDLKSLEVVLAICKDNSKSDIKDLNISQIDVRFQRDMSENLLVKTQALINLFQADVPREYAVPTVNLFSDPNAVVKEMSTLFGEQISQQGGNKEGNSNISQINKVQEQNNEITRVSQNDLQQK